MLSQNLVAAAIYLRVVSHLIATSPSNVQTLKKCFFLSLFVGFSNHPSPLCCKILMYKITVLLSVGRVAWERPQIFICFNLKRSFQILDLTSWVRNCPALVCVRSRCPRALQLFLAPNDHVLKVERTTCRMSVFYAKTKQPSK